MTLEHVYVYPFSLHVCNVNATFCSYNTYLLHLYLCSTSHYPILSLLQELCPPLVDDFLYLCDDAYTREDLLKMERDILKVVDYDINMPVAYRFLRRLARVSKPAQCLTD